MIAIVTPTDVERFRDLVAERLGLWHDEDKLDLLVEALRQRMACLGCGGFDAYESRLGRGGDELAAIADRLTVGETFFFRYPDQFRALSEVIRERLRATTRRPLRILSAGCASGEEPYSIAIMLREAGVAPVDVQIHAFDLSRGALERALRGSYTGWALRATPDELRDRYFRRTGRGLELDPTIRAAVSFEERNLVADDPRFWGPPGFDVILCRNVLMYFRPETMRQVVERVTRALAPGGYLFLGHAETLRGISGAFHLCHTHDTFYYQRRDGAEPAPVDRDREPAAAVADLVPDSSTSWMDAIRGASERIAALASSRTSVEPPASAARARVDLDEVHDSLRVERFTEALDRLSALPRESQDDPDVLLLRAVALTNAGRRVEAEAVCARLLAVDELSAGAHYLMALCREHAGDHRGAVDHDHAAIYLDAGFAMPHVHLGLMAKRTGDLATARHALTQALPLLAREDASRLILFGGGFGRDALTGVCRAELRAIGGDS